MTETQLWIAQQGWGWGEQIPSCWLFALLSQIILTMMLRYWWWRIPTMHIPMGRGHSSSGNNLSFSTAVLNPCSDLPMFCEGLLNLDFCSEAWLTAWEKECIMCGREWDLHMCSKAFRCDKTFAKGGMKSVSCVYQEIQQTVLLCSPPPSFERL